MTGAAARTAPAGRRGRRIVLMLTALAALLIIAANAHLVWVAVTSQPDCVPHARSLGGDGVYRAARSTC